MYTSYNITNTIGKLTTRLMTPLVFRVSPLLAILASVSISATFVVTLHLWRLAGYKDLNRDDPGTIIRRSLSVLLTCLCSALLVYSLAQPAGPTGGFTFLQLLGLQTEGMARASMWCITLTAILFVGPLVQHALGVAQGDSQLLNLNSGRWVLMRNYVFAPISEEFVFRACVVRLWVGAGIPTGVIIFCSPFFFALAHTHPFVEHVRRTGHKPTALKQVAFQVFYTSLFGMYCNFLLLRTGCTIAVILCHTFCNHQGFPDVSFLVDEYHPLYEQKSWIGGTYVVGVIGFCTLLGPMTAGFPSSFTPM